MKKITSLFILLLILVAVGRAQTPEPVYSFAKIWHPIEWYQQQQAAWKAEIDKNKTNAQAWYFYFRASRVLTMNDKSDNRTPDEKTKSLEAIVDEMEKLVPNSFEYNHARWIVLGFRDITKYPYLEKAAQLSPNNPLMLCDMINWGEMTRDIKHRDDYANRWYLSGDFSPGLLYYNYNMMAGLKENAIVITTGDNDTYPIWMLQAGQGFRKDITAINTSLITVKEYRDKLFKELGIPALDYNPWESKELAQKFNNELPAILASNTKKYPVYVALTACGDLAEIYSDKLYLTGLAYEYNTATIDNLALLKKNFEQNYALDYLDKYFYADISIEFVKRININYIVPMVKLYEHYILAGETQKAENLKVKALKVAEGTDEETEVKKYFSK